MTETIQQLKEDIAILQMKLQKLEEQQRTKTPVEECYKDWWGQYPELETDSQYDDTRWQGFQAGYEFAYAISTAKEVMEKVQEEQEEDEWKSVALRFGEKLSDVGPDGYYELSPDAWFRWAVFTYGKNQQIKDAVRESVKWCEEHPDKDPLDWLKPQTPEQVADGLKEAFREAVKQGVVSSSNKPQNPSLMKTKAQEVLYAYMDVERDLSQPKILIHTLKELINVLQVSPGIIRCPDIIELCEELKKL